MSGSAWPSRAGIALAAALLLPGCSRRAIDVADAGPSSTASSSVDDAPPPPSPAPPPRELAAHTFARSEARRSTVHRIEDDPALPRQQATLREHFGGRIPRVLHEQSASLDGGRRALLLTADGKEPQPLVLVVDAENALLWTKERPLAGIVPGVSEVAVVGGPDGDVALVWFDAPSRSVALRVWDADGGILADFVLATLDACGSLSATHWPGAGWIVACAEEGAARVQLLTEDGKLPWGPSGQELPWRSRASAPVTIVADQDSTIVLLQAAPPETRAAQGSDRVRATRLDATGRALWDEPLDAGPTPKTSDGRIATERIEPSRIRVGDGRHGIEITSGGVVTKR